MSRRRRIAFENVVPVEDILAEPRADLSDVQELRVKLLRRPCGSFESEQLAALERRVLSGLTRDELIAAAERLFGIAFKPSNPEASRFTRPVPLTRLVPDYAYDPRLDLTLAQDEANDGAGVDDYPPDRPVPAKQPPRSKLPGHLQRVETPYRRPPVAKAAVPVYRSEEPMPDLPACLDRRRKSP